MTPEEEMNEIAIRKIVREEIRDILYNIANDINLIASRCHANAWDALKGIAIIIKDHI